jgi:predicted SAM-dependent methyltransferase
MLSRKSKELFYQVIGPLMKLNGSIYKAFRSPKSENTDVIKVHLGPGQKNYLHGWLNLDANIFSGKADVWVDLRNSLPFRDNSIDVFYSHHVIEHLPDLRFHLKELNRCLKKGGKIRIGGPNGDSAIKKYLAGDHDWFLKFPDERKSIGGKLENFIFCRQEHLTILTFSYLEELLQEAGFTNIKQCLPTKETNFDG